MGKCLVVAGAARSGTSALAGALGACGVELGSNHLPANQFNPKGYCESWDVFELHDQCLRSFHRSWDSLLPLPSDWRKSEPARVARQRIHRLYKQEFERCALWAVKDARLCQLLPLWQDELPQVEFLAIVPVRHPFEVASSLARFSGKRWTESLLYWLYNLFESERTTRPFRRVLTTYPELLSDPVSLMSRLEKELGFTFPCAADERPSKLASWVEPNLRRFQLTDKDPAEEGLENLKSLTHSVYHQLIVQGQFHEPSRMEELFNQCFGAAYSNFASTFAATLSKVETSRSALQKKVCVYQSRARFRRPLKAFWSGLDNAFHSGVDHLIRALRKGKPNQDRGWRTS